MGVDLLARQRRPGGRAAGRVADPGGEVADDSTAMWPRSWNWRSLRSTTVKPRWMSDAVGSMPSFTRSGRPDASFSRSSSSVMQSTVPARAGAGAARRRWRRRHGQRRYRLRFGSPGTNHRHRRRCRRGRRPTRSASTSRSTWWRRAVVEDADRAADEIGAVVGPGDAQGLGEPGRPRAQVALRRAAGAGVRIVSTPCTGAPARSNTAPASAVSTATTLTHQCMP